MNNVSMDASTMFAISYILAQATGARHHRQRGENMRKSLSNAQ